MKKFPISLNNVSNPLTEIAVNSGIEKATDLVKHAISEREKTKRTISNNETAKAITKSNADMNVKIKELDCNSADKKKVTEATADIVKKTIEEGDDRKFDKAMEQFSKLVDSVSK